MLTPACSSPRGIPAMVVVQSPGSSQASKVMVAGEPFTANKCNHSEGVLSHVALDTALHAQGDLHSLA